MAASSESSSRSLKPQWAVSDPAFTNYLLDLFKIRIKNFSCQYFLKLRILCIIWMSENAIKKNRNVKYSAGARYVSRVKKTHSFIKLYKNLIK